jgi:hypothetical protein
MEQERLEKENTKQKLRLINTSSSYGVVKGLLSQQK